MGGTDDIRNKASEYGEKAKGARRQGSDRAQEGAQRAGQEASERTGGRFDEQAQRGEEQARRRMGQDSNDEPQDDWS
ncbi:antitoxin [Streptomyces sp. NRRL F-5123]|uniref:antitoxin n=1 Tax=Streptomyces sp. NRRL F-5123 TaxID=1463856 RepID=UPI0004E16DDB|nr:antitoxin [Streptomyces sp. NRRL F-5123]